MPYRGAHWFVVLVMAVTLAGFWQSYFSDFTGGPWQFHAHGVAASIWLVLVATQSWTAHRRQFRWHGLAGRASLLLFPFLIAGLAAIIDLTGKGYVAGEGPTRTLLGGSFLLGLLVAVGAYVTLFYRALKYRRKVWLHAGYMLATPLILWESPFSRLLIEWIPALAIAGPQDFGNIILSILLANATAIAFCLFLRWRFGERAHPFVIAALFIATQMVAMSLVGDLAVVRAGLALIGHTPSLVVVATGFALGALTAWAGWNAGKRTIGPVVAAAQPA